MDRHLLSFGRGMESIVNTFEKQAEDSFAEDDEVTLMGELSSLSVEEQFPTFDDSSHSRNLDTEIPLDESTPTFDDGDGSGKRSIPTVEFPWESITTHNGVKRASEEIGGFAYAF